MSKFVLGKKSLEELEGVHSDLVVVVHRAIELTVQDFSVHDGIRTLEEQKKLVESGASQTLDSRHITGHAVDLVPYINGKVALGMESHIQNCRCCTDGCQGTEYPPSLGGSMGCLFYRYR
jgi:hypothetical protein